MLVTPKTFRVQREWRNTPNNAGLASVWSSGFLGNKGKLVPEKMNVWAKSGAAECWGDGFETRWACL